MQTGDASERGYSYLAVLFLVALTAAGLAALGSAWHTAAQREKERELAFRGGEIARAIASYVGAGEGGVHPRRLEDLLIDLRGPKPRHHLRRLYPDPFTGRADWALIVAPGDPQGFHGVHSRSEQALLRQVQPDGSSTHLASDWMFLGQAHAVPAPVTGQQGGGSESLPMPVPASGPVVPQPG
ncbi:type II secretion system protein [Roseateles asaccharophilus]|uniref:Type II secretory pathway pseudopilin PulG n=1 Tax=Roseateles asaccharophilus TaxID=582607 RepID=A0ABU2ADB8_9BURK|nr:type II secretion system protein [Roseateles asaccharophilus]MDR7335192.1 type II secretory pathway pseudopilin PulG [Roseateles asaccharophilus]